MNNTNERRLSIMMTDIGKNNLEFLLTLFNSNKSKTLNNLIEALTPEICLSLKCISENTGADFKEIINTALVNSVVPKQKYKLNWINRLYEGETAESVYKDMFDFLSVSLRRGVSINTVFSRELIEFFKRNATQRFKALENFENYLSCEQHLLHNLRLVSLRILNTKGKGLTEKDKTRITKSYTYLKQNSIYSITCLFLDYWQIVQYLSETYLIMNCLTELVFEQNHYTLNSKELIGIIFSNRILDN